MSASNHLSVPAPGQAPLLPRELPWLCVFAPVPAAFLMIYDLTSMPLEVAARKIGAMYVPFIVNSAVLFALYTWVMPRLIARFTGAGARRGVHVAVVTVTAAVLSQLTWSAHCAMCGFEVPRWSFGISNVIVSYVMVFPAMLVQSARVRAATVEQFATAQRQAALRSQLEALQARTNPHFFFNSINTVASLIPDDPALAEKTLERLADLFRYALESSKTPQVPLAREFEMVREFLAIEGARFGERLRSTVHLDPQAAGLMVPPLLLQPLVENAILHGLAQRTGGRVDVSARREGDRIVIEVRDDGPGPKASLHQGTRTSVRDLLERLTLSYGERGTFALEEAEGGGCLARLALPAP